MVGGGDGNPFCQHGDLTKQEDVKKNNPISRKLLAFQYNDAHKD